jgi:tetratricopeptide (TPR) repeat protein
MLASHLASSHVRWLNDTIFGIGSKSKQSIEESEETPAEKILIKKSVLLGISVGIVTVVTVCVAAFMPTLAFHFYGLQSTVDDIFGNYQKAVEDASRALQFRSDVAAPYSNRCDAFYNLGNYENAIADCSRALEIEPRVDDYLHRGQAYSRIGEYRKAIEDYTKAVEYLEYMLPYFERGLAWKALGEKDKARADLQIALSLCRGTRTEQECIAKVQQVLEELH